MPYFRKECLHTSKKIVDENDESRVKTKKIETRPEDGFVREADIHEVNPNNYGKYFKGYSNSTVYTTSDPRITRPFIYGFCSLFLIIGILSLLFGGWFFGIIFIASATILFTKSKKDIDKIENELKANSNYDNSKEESRKVQKEFVEGIGGDLENATKRTFTKDNFNKFKKETLIVYCIISFIIFMLLAIFVNLFLGIFVLIVLVLCGFIYYSIISKICKW